MATKSRQSDPSLIRTLAERPQSFQLLAALQILEAAGVKRVLFRESSALSFPVSEITAFETRPAPGPDFDDFDDLEETHSRVKTPEAPPLRRSKEAVTPKPGDDVVLETAILALFGPNGPLPAPLAEALEANHPSRRNEGREFLSLFADRLVRLFMTALRQSRPATLAQAPHENRFAQALLALTGHRHLENQSRQDRSALIRNTGLLNQRPKSAPAIADMLSVHLGAPVKIYDLEGGWTALRPADRARLSALPGHNTSLASSPALGSRVWLQDSAVRISVGPLSRQGFESLLPGGTRQDSLMRLLRTALPVDCEIQCVLTLRPDEVPRAQLSERTGSRLGWTSWLSDPANTPERGSRPVSTYSIGFRGRASREVHPNSGGRL